MKACGNFCLFSYLHPRVGVYPLEGPLGCFKWGDGLKDFFSQKFIDFDGKPYRAADAPLVFQDFFPTYGDARGQFSGYEDGLSSCPKLNSYKETRYLTCGKSTISSWPRLHFF